MGEESQRSAAPWLVNFLIAANDEDVGRHVCAHQRIAVSCGGFKTVYDSSSAIICLVQISVRTSSSEAAEQLNNLGTNNGRTGAGTRAALGKGKPRHIELQQHRMRFN